MKFYLTAVSGGSMAGDPWIDCPMADSRDHAPPTIVPSLPAALRRRASPLTKEVAKRFFRVCQQSGMAPNLASIVLASDLGEISTTVKLLEHMAKSDPMSPTGFHNSVHNTAVGYVSIACQNHEPSTTIVAGADGFAMAMLEASMQIECGCEQLVVMVAEEELPAPMKKSSNGRVYSVAFAATKSVSASKMWIKVQRTSVKDACTESVKVADGGNIQWGKEFMDKLPNPSEQPGFFAVQQAMECGLRFERGVCGTQAIGAPSESGFDWTIEMGTDPQ